MDENKMDIEEFQIFGFLQEANRQFFHPLGLALAVNTGFKDDEELDKWLRDRGVQFGSDARDCVMTFIHLMGMDKAFLDSITMDSDPEGWSFGFVSEEQVQESLAKAQRVADRFNSYIKPRMDALGYVVQPPEDFHVLPQAEEA